MSRVYKALLEKYASDEAIQSELKITDRHLEIIKKGEGLPRWLTITIIRDHQINALYIYGHSKKKFITL